MADFRKNNNNHPWLIKDYDEDDLEAELDALGEELELEQQAVLDEQLLDVGPAVPSNLPEVITKIAISHS